MLEADTRAEALRLMHTYLTHEIQVLELRNKINSEARTEMNKEQRDYLLRQQMRAIQQELGEKGGEQAEVEQLRERLEKAELPEEVKKEAERELSRLEKLPPGAPDYNVIRTYLDYVLELPWNKPTEIVARYRACAPGAGRGSLRFERSEGAHSRASRCAEVESERQSADPVLRRTSGRGQDVAWPIHRTRLEPQVRADEPGGLHDEAELRGHRRTYIGAMPGRVIQAMRRAGAQ